MEAPLTKDVERLHNILLTGKCCSAALVQLALELRGEDNPRLVQAAGALCLGVRGGALCGAATGAALLLELLCPQYAADQLIPELMDWFLAMTAQRYGSANCRDIAGEGPLKRKLTCPGLVVEAYEKARELLQEYGCDPTGSFSGTKQ